MGSRLRVLLAVWVLLAALACDGGSGGGVGESGPRLLLRPTAADAQASTRVVARLDLVDDPAVVVVAERDELVTDGEARWRLVSGGPRHSPVAIRVRGPHRLDDVDQLVLRASGNTETRLALEVRRAGRRVGVAGPLGLAPSGITRLDVPAGLRGPADELVLHLDGRPRDVRVAEWELLDRPDAALVPAGEELVVLEREARRGWGLASGGALHGPSVPTGATALSFAVGQPPAAFARGELIVWAGVEELARLRLGVLPGWRTVQLPVRPGQGALRWELTTPGAALVAEPRWRLAVAEPRRVVLITSDTHRGDHLGSAARPVAVATPRLDALAGRGLGFQDCFASTNFTNPSHVALMTGVHPRDTGVLDNGHALLPSATTLAEHFADRGFATWAAVSAAHLRPEVSGLGQGFDRVAVPERTERSAEQTLDVVTAWLAEDAPAELFLWVHLFDAHLPYAVPEPFDRMYYDGPEDPFDPALPDPFARDPPGGNLTGLRVPEFGRAQYAAQVSYLDDQLARLLEHPALGDAVFAVVGDHGESLGAHDIWFDHDGLYTDTLHVPLVLAGPGVPAGPPRTDAVSHLDLGRTLLELAGVEPDGFPGHSLLAERPAPRFALAAHGSTASVTVADEHLVLRLTGRGPGRPAHAVELYDLASDPGCLTDLVDARPERAATLRRRLLDWLAAADPRGWVGEATEDAETLEQLRQLGYVGGASGRAAFVADACDWCRRFEGS